MIPIDDQTIHTYPAAADIKGQQWDYLDYFTTTTTFNGNAIATYL